MESAGIVDSLFIPHDIFLFAAQYILDSVSAFLGHVALVGWGRGKVEDEG